MKTFLFITSFFIANAFQAQQFVGNWIGNIQVQGIKMPLVFRIQEKNGQLSATLDSPSQKVTGIQVQKVLTSGNTITLELSNLNVNYVANYVNDSLVGNFSQNGSISPLKMSRLVGEYSNIVKRPQEPTAKKFNYHIQEVIIENTAEKVKLAGTLTIPKGKGPFPAVVLISGSGPQNRDSELLGHKPFWIIADYLSSNGIAVLRCDDRGVGKSTGNFSTATSANFATDAKAMLQFLRIQPKINASKTGILGHSEGGVIAPIAVADDPSNGFLILLAAPGIPNDSLMLLQNQMILKSSGESEEKINQYTAFNRKCYQLLKSNVDIYELDHQMELLIKNNYPDSSLKSELIRPMLQQFTSPWFRYFVNYDPTTYLKKIQTPVLAIQGDKDLQVSPIENIQGIESIFKSAGNKRVEIHLVPNKNHLFQTTTTGKIEEYGELEETFSPEVLEIIKNWILKLPNSTK